MDKCLLMNRMMESKGMKANVIRTNVRQQGEESHEDEIRML